MHQCVFLRVVPSFLLMLALCDFGLGCSSSPKSQQTPTFNFAWDWTGIVGTGQSLSVGTFGTPVIAAQQPYGNLKLAFGGATVAPPFDPTIASLTLVPLTEPIRPFATGYPSAYPDNISGETPHTAMANQLTAMVMAMAMHDYVSIPTVVGESGQPMTSSRRTPPTSRRGHLGPRLRRDAVRGVRDHAPRRRGGKDLRHRRDRHDPRRVGRQQQHLRQRPLPAADRLQHGPARDHRSDHQDPDAGVAAEFGPGRHGIGVGLRVAGAEGRRRSPGRHRLHGSEVPVLVRDRQRARPPIGAGVRARRREDRAGLLRAGGARARLAAAAAHVRRGERQRRHRPLSRAGPAAESGTTGCRRRTERRSRSGRRGVASS